MPGSWKPALRMFYTSTARQGNREIEQEAGAAVVFVDSLPYYWAATSSTCPDLEPAIGKRMRLRPRGAASRPMP